MIQTLFDYSREDRHKIDERVGRLRSVTEFCAECLEGSKELPIKSRLEKILPWAVRGGELVKEVAPLAKLVAKIIDECLKEKDPEILGNLACTLAYQRAAVVALAQTGKPIATVPFSQPIEQAKQALKKLGVVDSLAGFSLECPLAHPFTWKADEALHLVTRHAGYSESEWRQIQQRVHKRFSSDLSELLAHEETAKQFEPFTRWLKLGNDFAARAALNAHLTRQRWLFEGQAVLNKEPFTLRDVYVDTDCGELAWRDFLEQSKPDISKADKRGLFDPFSEKWGGRQPLLETVCKYIGTSEFNDAIIIQGAPGSGKSAFTLRLANFLSREGLVPIRVRLRLLRLGGNLKNALGEVVLMPEEHEDPSLGQIPKCSDPLIGGAIFDERTTYRDAAICPYVLILDGWDEISVAVNEGFENEVRRMLDNIYYEFLRPRSVPVRVILTGRPSDAIRQSQIMTESTPILTIRSYSPQQLEEYARKLQHALESDRSVQGGAGGWPPLRWEQLQPILETYRKDPEKLEVLSQPLLAHLAMWLVANWRGTFGELLSNRTSLYRSLVDLTCRKAAKAYFEPEDVRGQARLTGAELRHKLHETAAAITTFGQEAIPFSELSLRLNLEDQEMMDTADAASSSPLTKLMISFYFKGGKKHLGCEFLHKSFREYLYAEGIIEVLKEYGRDQKHAAPERSEYWRDFDELDDRYRLSRELSKLVSARPLTEEIRSHLAALISWEIGRSKSPDPLEGVGDPLPPITFQQWQIVRDGLVDLWDWWGEAAYLRPIPFRDKSRNLSYAPAFVNELENTALPQDRGRHARDVTPGRVLNIDSNLGDALCRLNGWVHKFVLEHLGYWPTLGVYIAASPVAKSAPRRYQTLLKLENSEFVLFKPSGSTPNYFRSYICRINACGTSPGISFPAGIDFTAADLSGTDLRGVNLSGADLAGANLSEADLTRADLSYANLTKTDLSNADLALVQLNQAVLTDAILLRANLNYADLAGASRLGWGERFLPSAARMIHHVSRLWRSGTNLSNAHLMHARMRGAALDGVNLSKADLTQADLRGAKLRGAKLDDAILDKTDLRGSDLNDVDRRKVDFSRARTDKSPLLGFCESDDW
jgi:uncharacterized protein YjbI with pentapeptide repeats